MGTTQHEYTESARPDALVYQQPAMGKPSRRKISSFCSGERMGEFTASNQRVILLLAWKYSRRHAV